MTVKYYWRKLTIPRKFAVAFGLLLVLMSLVALAGYWAVNAVQKQTETAIVTSMQIYRLTLGMHNQLQQARRIEKEFILYRQPLGMDKTTQDLITLFHQNIGEVTISTSALQKLTSSSNVGEALRHSGAGLTAYNSLVNLYADNFDQAVSLTADLNRPETGVLARIEHSAASLYNTLQTSADPLIIQNYWEMRSAEKGYLLSRHSPDVPAIYRHIALLRRSLTELTQLNDIQKVNLLTELNYYEAAIKELVAVDSQLRELQTIFDSRISSLDPIANNLATEANNEVERARSEIGLTSQVASTFFILAVLAAIAFAVIIALVLNNSITRKVVQLSQAARALQQGRLDTRVDIQRGDELGALADTFNSMAGRMKNLIEQLETQASTAETRLFEAVDGISEGFSLYDAEDRLVLSNHNYREMHAGVEITPGMRFEEIIRVAAQRGHYMDAIGRVDEWVQERLARHRNPGRPFEELLSDGRWFQVSEYKTQDGDIVALRADITARKQLDKIQASIYRILEAANTVAQLDDLFRIIHSIIGGLMVAKNFYIALYDPATDKLTYPYYVDEFDEPPAGAEPLGHGLTAYVLRADAPLLTSAETIEKLMQQGDIAPIGTIPVDWLGVPLRINDQAIGVMVTQSYQAEVRLGEAEQNILMLAANPVAMAIERQRTEAALRASETLYKTLFNTAPIGIFTKDRAGYYTSANTDLLQYWPHSPVGYRDADLLPAHIAAGLRWADVQVMEANEGLVLEEDMETPRGLCTVLSRKVPLHNAEGQVVGILGVSLDITQRKQAEAALQRAKEAAESANRAKSQFLANMSHELRTPLNAIIGYSEMLQEEAQDLGEPHLIADLEKIRTAGKHLLAIINDILDLSKIEAGKMQLYLENFDVPALVQEVVSTVTPLIEKGQNTLQVQCADGLGLMRSDVTKVRQALFNLLSNASKFTQQGTIQLTVAKLNLEKDTLPLQDWNLPASLALNTTPEWLIFRVTDSGIGMEAEQIERVFDAFTQADASTTRKYGGTGLGLSITHRFCKLLGGDISVQSTVGQGSTFTICLPTRAVALSSEPFDEAPLDAPVPQEVKPSGAPTILVIDDDPTVLDLMRRFLTKEGYWVETAGSGEMGLELARTVRPAVITLDVMMAGMDGWSVLTALKADPDLAHTPVIMLTMIDDKNLGYALGAADYLTKPIDRTRLAAVLSKYSCDRARCTVLLVEDDADTRSMMRWMLAKEGWTIVEAENGQVALTRVVEQPPELILLDLMMPQMDGFTFITELRQNPQWRTIPIVVITAMSLTPEERMQLNGYVIQILQKSAYTREQLLGEVRDLVNTVVRPDFVTP
jgi:PAS domain S-box-containing protein